MGPDQIYVRTKLLLLVEIDKEDILISLSTIRIYHCIIVSEGIGIPRC